MCIRDRLSRASKTQHHYFVSHNLSTMNIMFNIENESHPGSVSYTHLDVYKRQALYKY